MKIAHTHTHTHTHTLWVIPCESHAGLSVSAKPIMDTEPTGYKCTFRIFSRCFEVLNSDPLTVSNLNREVSPVHNSGRASPLIGTSGLTHVRGHPVGPDGRYLTADGLVNEARFVFLPLSAAKVGPAGFVEFLSKGNRTEEA